MRKTIEKAFLLILCAVLSVCIAQAGPKDHGKGKEKEKHWQARENEKSKGAHVNVEVFVGGDHDRIRNYYIPRKGGLPPGLAKRRGDLPPGLRKQLRRKGHLPQGLEKRLYVFPVELERELPPLQPGLVRGMIGGTAVIYNPNTRIILDVFTIF